VPAEHRTQSNDQLGLFEGGRRAFREVSTEMCIRAILGIDLAGRLRTCMRRYKGDTRMFDHTAVWCLVSKWSNGTATVDATAYCSDPSATGLSTAPVALFYSSPTMKSVDEAEAYLSAEVARAATKCPESNFYRLPGGAAEEKMRWISGTWHPVDHVPSHQRCRGCGYRTDEPLCPRCGEPVF